MHQPQCPNSYINQNPTVYSHLPYYSSSQCSSSNQSSSPDNTIIQGQFPSNLAIPDGYGLASGTSQAQAPVQPYPGSTYDQNASYSPYYFHPGPTFQSSQPVITSFLDNQANGPHVYGIGNQFFNNGSCVQEVTSHPLDLF